MLAAQLQRLWAGERGFGTAALGAAAGPAAAVFGTVVRARGRLYDSGLLPSSSATIPVISIGNLAVGGTGKTPVSAWLARELRQRGWMPAIVMRGHGEDEVLLHRRWNPDIPVIVSRRRLDGVREAGAAGRNIAVIDDGFQHRQLRRDLDLVLLSPAHPLPAKLLPRGPFREPLRALRRADCVLVTAKGPQEIGPATELVAELRQIPGAPPIELLPFRAGPWQTLERQPAPPPAGAPLVLCSIAQSEGFHRLAQSASKETAELLAFPDHHTYTEGEVRRIRSQAGPRWIATTEKDSVKLAPFRELLTEVRVLPLVPPEGGTLADRVLQPLGAPDATEALE